MTTLYTLTDLPRLHVHIHGQFVSGLLGEPRKALCLMEHSINSKSSKFGLFAIPNELTQILIYKMFILVVICLRYAGLD